MLIIIIVINFQIRIGPLTCKVLCKKNLQETASALKSLQCNKHKKVQIKREGNQCRYRMILKLFAVCGLDLLSSSLHAFSSGNETP